MKLYELGSSRFTLTYFGGDPLLNQPVIFERAERLWRATRDRGVEMRTNVITNGLLLTPAPVSLTTVSKTSSRISKPPNEPGWV
jgi:sulfatase maturation enzyme AslB (radical SAM superfamily)